MLESKRTPDSDGLKDEVILQLGDSEDEDEEGTMCWGCSVQMTGAIPDRRLERDRSIATGRVKVRRERIRAA